MKAKRNHLFLCMSILLMIWISPATFAATLRVGHGVWYDYTTITAALAAANSGDTITVAAGTYQPGAPYNETFPLVMRSAARLMWENTSSMPVIDAGQSDRVFLCENLAAGSRIEGFIITGGMTSAADRVGGGLDIRNSELVLSDCEITDNYAQDSGGGMYCFSSTVTLHDCVISGNIADQGGGIYARTGSSLNINRCLISGNVTTYTGAGIYITSNCSVSIEGSEISGNDSSQYGGGIFFYNVDANIFNCLIEDNHADLQGGGLAMNDSTVYGNQNAWIGNTSPAGGAIFARENSVLKMFECVIGNNTTTETGGGIQVSDSEIQMLFSKIAANSATNSGGGLSLKTATGVIAMCEFIDNTSVNGAGINFDNNSETQIVNCLFARNHATEFGGALFFNDSAPEVTHCTMTDNYAADGGGSMACSAGNPVVTNSILWDNDIDEVFVFSGTPVITFCDVEGGWSGSATNFNADPLFITGSDGSFFLSQTVSGQPSDSPCVNTGSGSSTSLSYSILDRFLYMDTMTTRTDNGTDAGLVDVGYHYDPTYCYCTEFGCSIDIPSTFLHAGDPFYCHVTACNPDLITYPDIPLFVLLDVFGTYFFAPGFSDFDYYEINLIPGKTAIEVIPEFSWPSNVGSASGIVLYAAMTDHNMTSLFGTLDAVTFGW
jgi:hypothetical protein